MSAVSGWPSSPLDAAQRAFTLLVHPPTQVGFDGRGVDGLPGRILPLDELRTLLLSPATNPGVRDVVWRELVVRSRRDGPAWVVAAVGMALPGLRRVAGQLTAGWRGDSDDLDSELLLGFVARLRTLDVGVPRVCGRLIDAGLRAARRARDAESDTHLVPSHTLGPIAPIQPWDHPELVLARAVAVAVIDTEEAHLIAATRLGDSTVAEVAVVLGISAGTAAVWRAKAERRLVEAIAGGELAFVPLRPRRRARGAVPATSEGGVVGGLLGSDPTSGVVLGTQQGALGGKTPDRQTAGVGVPGGRGGVGLSGSCSHPTGLR
ncbi:MAG: hypothetical protein HYR62_02690 [Actinobacteria bacterium]|nr:hypothetical protein [Actinomycetota bacterium]MBI3687380.1 hypothetical protein [Actinomycetota bacterium]